MEFMEQIVYKVTEVPHTAQFLHTNTNFVPSTSLCTYQFIDNIFYFTSTYSEGQHP